MITMRKSVFKDASKLSLSYIPSRIPHRELKLQQLLDYFRSVMEDRISYEHVFIVGNTGTGKTLVVKHFEKIVSEREDIIPIYVNSRFERSPGNIIRKMIGKLSMERVARGYSLEEVFSSFLSYLIDSNKKAILILDDADHLFDKHKEFIYKLSRAEEASPSFVNNLSLVFVVHGEDVINKLDPWTAAGLHKNIIRFEDYTYRELIDILRYRSSEAFHEESITDEAIITAADIATAYNYNARYAIELLYKAGMIADKRREGLVKAEHVRLARRETFPAFSFDELKTLELHEKILLYSVADILASEDKAFITMGELERRYRDNCLFFHQKPVGHTWLWKMVNVLATFGLVTKRLSGEGYRGKTTLIGLPSFPAEPLAKELYELIKSDVKGER